MLTTEHLDAIEIAGIESFGARQLSFREEEGVSGVLRSANKAPQSPQGGMWASTVASLSAQIDQESEYEMVTEEAIAVKTLSLSRARDDAVEDVNPTTVLDRPIPRVPQDGDFQRLSVLGLGSFGRVVLAKHISTGELYALKLIAFSKLRLKKDLERTKTERDVLCDIEHEHVVKLYFAYRTKSHFALVSEYCPGGELFQHLCKKRALKSEAVAFYAAELMLALGYVHGRGIVYRDVKPENCVLDARGHLKLVDFGLAKANIFEKYSGAHSVCGTLEYMAPDVLAKKPSGYGLAVDWWGLGVWTYELLTGLPPWRSKDRAKLFRNIRRAPIKIPPYVSLEAGAFLAVLLRRHPRQRLVGLEEAKLLPFFAAINFNTISNSIKPPIQPCVRRVFDNDNVGLANFDAKFATLSVREPPERPVGVELSVDSNTLADWDYARHSAD